MILLSLFAVVFAVYPSIVSSDQVNSIDEMTKIFPKEVLAAFNMDIASLSTAFGWLKSEGFVFILLIIGVYSSLLGSNILVKEENDKTIEYLNSLPISRKEIVINKALVGILYIVLITILIGVFNFICLKFSGEFDMKQYLLMSVTPLFSSLVLYSMCLFLSTFTHKTKNMIGISFGLTFVSYIFNAISTIAKSVDWLKYISVFTLADIRNIIINNEINPMMIFLSLIITFLFIVLSVVNYQKKDLV
jgi:ABC-2 type transport system permease protein